MALRTAAALGFFWSRRAAPSEGRFWLESAIAQVEAMPAALEDPAARAAHARAYGWLGQTAMASGETSRRAATLRGALSWRRRPATTGPGPWRSACWVCRAPVRRTWRRRVRICRRPSTSRAPRTTGPSSPWPWEYWPATGSPSASRTRARACAEEAIALAAETGNRWFSGMARQNLALIATLQGAYDEASRHLEASLAILTEMGDRHFANVATSALADIARLPGTASVPGFSTGRSCSPGATSPTRRGRPLPGMPGVPDPGRRLRRSDLRGLPSRRTSAGRRSRASPAPCRADGRLRGGRVPHLPGCIAGQAWRSGVCRRMGVNPGLHRGTGRCPRPARFLSSRISRSYARAFFPLFSRSPAILGSSNREMALASIFRTMPLPDGAIKQARRTGQDHQGGTQ